MSSRPSPLATLFLTVFLDLLGFGMVIPILPLYAKQFDVSDLAVTAMGASYSVMQLLFSTVWGRLSDRRGRRPVLLVSIAGSCLSQLGYALAPASWGHAGFLLLLLARMVAGVCGANIAAAQAYIADTTDEKGRAAGMGLLGMAMGLGFVLGPGIGGLLKQLGPAVPFFVASGLAAVNFAMAYATLVEPKQRTTSGRGLSWAALGRAVATPRVRALIFVMFAITFGFSNLEQTFPFYLQRRFHWDHEIGYVFSYLGLIMVVVQGVLVRRLVARFGERWLVVAGTGLLATGMIVQSAAYHLPGVVASVTLIAVGQGLTSPSLSSLISRAAGADRQGGVLGVSQSFSSLGRIIGPLTGGWLLAFGEAKPVLFGGAIIAATSVLAALFVQPPAPLQTIPTGEASAG